MNPPKCATEGCDNPAMVQCPDCAMHWDIRFSAWWDARWPDEDESLPFQEGEEEAREDYAPDAAYADQWGQLKEYPLQTPLFELTSL